MMPMPPTRRQAAPAPPAQIDGRGEVRRHALHFLARSRMPGRRHLAGIGLAVARVRRHRFGRRRRVRRPNGRQRRPSGFPRRGAPSSASWLAELRRRRPRCRRGSPARG